VVRSIKKHITKTAKSILFLPVSIILVIIASSFPHKVEYIYSQNMFKVLGQFLNRISGWFAFSIGEILLIFLLIYICILLINLRKQRSLVYRQGLALTTVGLLSMVYFIFLVSWGLNYYRLPLKDLHRLNTSSIKSQELEAVCQLLINEANILRNRLEDNKLSGRQIRNNIFNRSHIGYDRLSKQYPELEGSFSNPKPVLLSSFMSYLGISGIYSPFTGEANVNINLPPPLLPVTACHEMAHQRGVAREDEANFVAYLACTAHYDLNFKYSGTLFALIYAMDALHKDNPQKYKELRSMYSAEVRQDIKAIDDFWKSHKGWLSLFSSRLNNFYLQLNNQAEGVQSYNKMVLLLIADYRLKYTG